MKFRAPDPRGRPGDMPGFPGLGLPAAGSVRRPPVDSRPGEPKGMPVSMARVPDDNGRTSVRDRRPGAAHVRRTGTTDSVTEIRAIGLRRRIAERMPDSAHNTPRSTHVEEVGASRPEGLRESASRDVPGDSRPTTTSSIVRAMVLAIGDRPRINSHHGNARGAAPRSDRAAHTSGWPFTRRTVWRRCA